jgi:hypothetical protein
MISVLNLFSQENAKIKFNQGVPEKYNSHSNICGQKNGKVYTITRTSDYAKAVHFKLFTIQMYNSSTLKLEKEMEPALDDLPGIAEDEVYNGDQEFGKDYNVMIVNDKLLFFYWDFHKTKEDHIQWKYILFLKQYDLKTLTQVGTAQKLMESRINDDKPFKTSNVSNSFEYWYYNFSPDSSKMEIGLAKSSTGKGVGFYAFGALDTKTLKVSDPVELPGKGEGFVVWDAVVTNQGKQYAIMGQYGKDKKDDFGLFNLSLVDFGHGGKVLAIGQPKTVYKSANLIISPDNKLYVGGTGYLAGNKEKLGSFLLSLSDEGEVRKAVYNELSEENNANLNVKDYEKNKMPGDKRFWSVPAVVTNNTFYFISQPVTISENGGGQFWMYKSYVVSAYAPDGKLKYQHLIPSADAYILFDRFYAKGNSLLLFNSESKANVALDVNHFDENDVDRRQGRHNTSCVSLDENGTAKRSIFGQDQGKGCFCAREAEYYYLKFEGKKMFLGMLRM